MTTPDPQPAPARVVVAYPSFRRILLVVGALLFVLGAFAFGGHPLAGIPGAVWDSGAAAAWVLSGAVP
jgi:hypothetical protein